MQTPFLHTKSQQPPCDLCGLTSAAGMLDVELNGEIRHFCCTGCRMVYTMLLEACDASDPAAFKQSELYRRCVAAGVIPASAGTSAPGTGRTGSRRL